MFEVVCGSSIKAAGGAAGVLRASPDHGGVRIKRQQQKWPKRREQSASKDQNSGATKDFLSRTRSGIQNLLIYPADKVLKRCRTGQMSLKGKCIGKVQARRFCLCWPEGAGPCVPCSRCLILHGLQPAEGTSGC